MKKTLLISSLACLALLIYAPIDTFLFQEYHHHQRDYRQLLSEIATSEAERSEAENYPIKIRQLVLPDLERTDRCISCHVGIEDPRMLAQPQPLRNHPGDYLIDHDIAKLGCTVCHDGQGRAMVAELAHATSIAGWEKPILRPPFIQANCLRCHEVEDLPGLETVKKGKDLFTLNGCLGCHQVESRGGTIGPDLTHIADASPRLKRPVTIEEAEQRDLFHGNVNLAYIFESIKEPQAQPSVTAMAMAEFGFSDDDAIALTIYLKGLSKREIPASYLARRTERRRTEILQGRLLFAKYCSACHNKEGQGGIENPNYAGKTVPALNTLAEKMFLEYEEDAEYLAELLRDGVNIEEMSPPLDVDGRGRVLAQYRALRDIIKNGSTAAREDPEGPAPLLHMPSWAEGLTNKNIDSIFAYLLTVYPWQEEEEEY